VKKTRKSTGLLKTLPGKAGEPAVKRCFSPAPFASATRNDSEPSEAAGNLAGHDDEIPVPKSQADIIGRSPMIGPDHFRSFHLDIAARSFC
jgi:hypothetical protein